MLVGVALVSGPTHLLCIINKRRGLLRGSSQPWWARGMDSTWRKLQRWPRFLPSLDPAAEKVSYKVSQRSYNGNPGVRIETVKMNGAGKPRFEVCNGNVRAEALWRTLLRLRHWIKHKTALWDFTSRPPSRLLCYINSLLWEMKSKWVI